MVNFIFVIDPNDMRRVSFVDKIRGLIAPVKGLTISFCSNNNFAAVWAAGDWTPISQVNDEEGTAVIFGDAVKGSGERLTAPELRRSWLSSRVSEALDGFHVAFAYCPEKGLTVGADLLGLFPLYYYVFDEVVLVGSSPWLFQFHPSFVTSLNLEGLVGIFLTKWVLDGQTVLSGVKRLGAGCLLKCDMEKQAEEIVQFKIPVSERYFDLKLAEQIEVIHQALNEAICRHIPRNVKHCLMLSGGLDSSLLGGYLRNNARNVVAVTDGIPSDNEMKCATSMAKTLGFEHVKFDVGYQNYVHFAELSTSWEHMDGFVGLPAWGFIPYLRRISHRAINGRLGDAVFGYATQRAFAKPWGSVSFSLFLRRTCSWALRPETLRRLLEDKAAQNLVDAVLRKTTETYENYDGQDFQKIWSYSLNHIARFHAGSGLWTLSFGSWPVLPFVDRRVLEVLGGMPIEAMSYRRLEKELFKTKFPELASLPLSSNDFGSSHLAPTFSQTIASQFYSDDGLWRYKTMHDLRNALFLALKGERRYWKRTATGFYSPGWRDVRKEAEPFLNGALPPLDSERIRKLMPSPGASFPSIQWKLMRGGIDNVSGLKLLMQYAMWSERNHENLRHAQQKRQPKPGPD